MRDRVGGTTIFVFKIARLLGTLALFLLLDFTTHLGGWKWVDVAQVITLVRETWLYAWVPAHVHVCLGLRFNSGTVEYVSTCPSGTCCLWTSVAGHIRDSRRVRVPGHMAVDDIHARTQGRGGG